MSDTTEIKRQRLDEIERELEKRQEADQKIIEVVKANFVIHPRARVQPPMVVYEVICANLHIPNSPKFRARVRDVLRPLGLYHKQSGGSYHRAFTGLGTQEYLDWRLAEDEIVKRKRSQEWSKLGGEPAHGKPKRHRPRSKIRETDIARR